MNDLIDGILLESYNLFLPYTYSLTEVIDNLIYCNASYDFKKMNTLEITSRLFGSVYNFKIFISYDNEKMQNISICYILNEEELLLEYRRVQRYFKAILGVPSNYMEAIFNTLSTDYKKYIWSRKNIRIEHSLWERFGLCARINICVNEPPHK